MVHVKQLPNFIDVDLNITFKSLVPELPPQPVKPVCAYPSYYRAVLTNHFINDYYYTKPSASSNPVALTCPLSGSLNCVYLLELSPAYLTNN